MASDARLDLYSYQKSAEIDREDYPFYALIAAAVRKADTHNLGLLRAAWPGVVMDLERRYNAPGGRLDGEFSTGGRIE